MQELINAGSGTFTREIAGLGTLRLQDRPAIPLRQIGDVVYRLKQQAGLFYIGGEERIAISERGASSSGALKLLSSEVGPRIRLDLLKNAGAAAARRVPPGTSVVPGARLDAFFFLRGRYLVLSWRLPVTRHLLLPLPGSVTGRMAKVEKLPTPAVQFDRTDPRVAWWREGAFDRAVCYVRDAQALRSLLRSKGFGWNFGGFWSLTVTGQSELRKRPQPGHGPLTQTPQQIAALAFEPVLKALPTGQPLVFALQGRDRHTVFNNRIREDDIRQGFFVESWHALPAGSWPMIVRRLRATQRGPVRELTTPWTGRVPAGAVVALDAAGGGR